MNPFRSIWNWILRLEYDWVKVSAGITLFWLIGLIGLVLYPYFVGGKITLGGHKTTMVTLLPTNKRVPLKVVPYDAQELRGRQVYVSEGCWYCHTQTIRTIAVEMARYGAGGIWAPYSRAQEYEYDWPQLMGEHRHGPDLSRVGGIIVGQRRDPKTGEMDYIYAKTKYSNGWQYAHLRDPRSLVPGSIMPQFPDLFDQYGRPTRRCRDLVAYLQHLGSAIDWRPQTYKSIQPPPIPIAPGTAVSSSSPPPK